MITRETGPAKILKKFREGVEKKFGPESSLTEGVNCILCVSFWLSWIVAWPFSTSNVNYIFSALAMSAVVLFFSKFFLGR